MPDLEANRKLVARAEEAWNENALDEALGYFSDDYHENTPFPGLPPTKQGLSQLFHAFRGAFPDAHVTLDFMIAEGDLVGYHSTARGTHTAEFMGIPATGRSVEVGALHVHRVQDGKIVEHWGYSNQADLMAQLGVAPGGPPGGGPPAQ